MTQYTYILSTGRTGTQFLALYFDQNYPNVAALHEPKPSYRLHIMANAYVAGKVPRPLALALFQRWRKALIGRYSDKDHFIESNNFLYGLIDLMPELVSDPVIIHIVRDPREFVRSTINYGAWYGYKWFASKFVPYWFADLREHLHPYKNPSVAARFAAQWAHVNLALQKGGNGNPGYRCLKFEDIFKPPYEGLRHICDILGLAYCDGKDGLSPEEIKNPSRYNFIGSWPSWTAQECRELQEICGPLMAQYGYGGEPEWLEKLGEKSAPLP